MISPLICRSREGAWIEIHLCGMLSVDCMGRSREGAWIEMAGHLQQLQRQTVAPVRERGLKYVNDAPEYQS